MSLQRAHRPPVQQSPVPHDLVLLVGLWRLRYQLSLRDRAAMFLERGFAFTHETVRDWAARFTPFRTARRRATRKGQAGTAWYADETYGKIAGAWHYLYRASDRDGDLVDSMVSKTRDMDAAKRFFHGAKEVTGGKPTRVTTEGHPAYQRAIRRGLGRKVKHRHSRYRNKRLEQDQRGVKQRYYPMRGFGNFDAAARFCRAYDEQRNYFRVGSHAKQGVGLAEQRRILRPRLAGLQESLIVA